jgi:hypothetical protein
MFEGLQVMFTTPISVTELKNYWRRWESSQNEAFYIIPISCMPPWRDVCSQLRWRSRLLEPWSFSRKRWNHCGVYRLVALASDNQLESPAVLSRICGQDTTGTLYIGDAGDLGNRLNQLRRSLRGGERSHHAATILRDTPLLEFPSIRLAVSALFTGKSTGLVEKHMVMAYINSFGDTPPLNYRI